MSPGFQSVLLNWEIPPLTTLALLLAALVYLRGWLLIGRTRPEQFPEWRLVCFLGGLSALFVAVASPFDTLDGRLLSAHMVQHFLFMSVAPPLLLLSAPQVPLLRGLPRIVIRGVLGPLFRLHWLKKVGRFLTSMKPAWLAMNIAYIGWHVPGAYELALRSENWHNVEHACFFFTSILFWWPILRPWPTRNRNLSWMLIPYILTSDLINTGLSAFLCFAGRPVYPSYVMQTNPLGISALNDQVAAGAFMWVFGSTVFLVPAFWITMRLLAPNRGRKRVRVNLPLAPTKGV
ncbi:cytochrome c oxidase assembly protein [Acidobacterium sp. S8]|uniref:cytochrome c oxidase assembly protein n=1 Tax=Acidobacterium sp. S8 TaxID=1641854 RepID=UPI00131E8926|nr:cytochrome c oxidase assembly protein [Acidobacterium sp. S8]